MRLSREETLAYSREYSREQYADCLRLGICGCCKSADTSPGYSHCDQCREDGRKYYYERGRAAQLARRAARREAGLCIACGKRPSATGIWHGRRIRKCDQCRKASAKYARLRRERLKEDA